mgnify:CR=1 FL=1
MPFERGFKANANRISLRVREKMGLFPIDPLDPFAVCDFFEIEVIKLSDLKCDASCFLGPDQSAFSAVTVPCGARTAIVHNDAHHVHRQRSNICHELAHSFLGHAHAPPLTDEGLRIHDGGIEAEANFMSGTLLIPNEAALHIVRTGIQSSARRLYGVSSQMLEYRLRVSGARTIYSRKLAALEQQ